MLCSETISVNQNANEGCASLLKCRRWSCEKCLPDLRKEVIRKALRGKPTAMVTLTCNPSRYETPDEAARDLKRALVLLRRHMKEKRGIDRLPFIVVFERTKNGWPHMHLLVRAKYIPQRWISGEMARLIGAPIVDIRRIRGTKEAASYVAKYIGKEPYAFEGSKRWWRSHNYELEKPEKVERVRYGFDYRREAGTIPEYVQQLIETGAIIIERNRRFVHWKEALPLDAYELLTGKRKPFRKYTAREGPQ